ncbi:hypothetical protein G9A89_004818 [Geosiphon pyriformis]|nr:hypothetical protein G9A89_004818 [Geosiphon pyriformis]
MSLIVWPSTLALVYIVVIGFSLSVALLNKEVADSSSILKENIATSNLSSVIVAGSMLLISDFWFVFKLLDEASSEVTRKLK